MRLLNTKPGFVREKSVFFRAAGAKILRFWNEKSSFLRAKCAFFRAPQARENFGVFEHKMMVSKGKIAIFSSRAAGARKIVQILKFPKIWISIIETPPPLVKKNFGEKGGVFGQDLD